MIGNGRSDVFVGLIIPHGLLELSAVFIAAGAGQYPWPRTRPDRPLRHAGRARAGRRFGISGLVEAFATPSRLPTAVRIAIGVLVWSAFLCYVVVLGRRAQAEQVSADLDAALNDDVRPTG